MSLPRCCTEIRVDGDQSWLNLCAVKADPHGGASRSRGNNAPCYVQFPMRKASPAEMIAANRKPLPKSSGFPDDFNGPMVSAARNS